MNDDLKDEFPSLVKEEHVICTADMIRNMVNNLPDTKNTRFIGIAIASLHLLDKQRVRDAIETINNLMEGLEGKDIEYALNELKVELGLED